MAPPQTLLGSLQRSTDPLAGFNGPTSKGKGEGEEGIGGGEGGEEEWGSPTHYFRLKSCTGMTHDRTPIQLCNYCSQPNNLSQKKKHFQLSPTSPVSLQLDVISLNNIV